jgi:hypothetical protein
MQKLFYVAALQNYSSSSSTYPAPQFLIFSTVLPNTIGLVQHGEGGVALSANQGNCDLEDFFSQFTDAQFP